MTVRLLQPMKNVQSRRQMRSAGMLRRVYSDRRARGATATDQLSSELLVMIHAETYWQDRTLH